MKEEDINLALREWNIEGSFVYPGHPSEAVKFIKGGIYKFQWVAPGMWRLALDKAKFEFPSKIYDSSSKIINRIRRQWKSKGGTLGVLFNGLKGSGKSVTAQLLANSFVEDDIPVLLVNGPIPLGDVLSFMNQPVVVIFDEFEKTHAKPEEQHALLSVVDGMSKSPHPRLFLFTTNKMTIDENFINRPTRILYNFTFGKLSTTVINMLLDDKLPSDCEYLREDIISFLKSRAICTIDIACAVIDQVAIHKESPYEFEEYFNATKGDPPGFKVEILNPETHEPIKVHLSFFVPYEKSFINAIYKENSKFPVIGCSSGNWPSRLGFKINLLEKVENGIFIANLAIPVADTDLYKLAKDTRNGSRSIYLDEKPDDWTMVPPEDTKLEDHAFDLVDRTYSFDTLHGTDRLANFLIRITETEEAPIRTYDLTKYGL